MSNQVTLDLIRDMAKLTMVSGRINEIQEKNLKSYPFVFFNDITNVTIDYDFSNSTVVNSEENKKTLEIEYTLNKESNTNNLRVSYHLTSEDANQVPLDKRCKAIERAVHDLFWKEVRVEIYFNDIIVYNGGKDV